MSLIIEIEKKLGKNYSEIHKDIIELSKQKNAKAQYQLYMLYSKAMFNVSYRMMNNREEAEDMLQEAFSEAFHKLNSYRYESSFGAWLKRIIVNKCINEIKRRKADVVLFEHFNTFEIKEEKVDYDGAKLEVDKVKKAIEKLADGFRVIITLYLFEGYDHVEISNILGISESTSKSQYLRAKRKLVEIIKTESYG